MKLELQEQMAINTFLSDNWGEFKKTALEFMEEDEIDELGEKLANFDSENP